MDCDDLIYPKDEKHLYGKNKVLKNGDIAYLCRLYSKKRCKSRLYMRNGRLFRQAGYFPHNHGKQSDDQFEFKIEAKIKAECQNIESLVNAKTQTSVVSEIFHKNMRV